MLLFTFLELSWLFFLSFFFFFLRFNKLPLFADAGYAEKDRMTIKAAYWATYCAYKQNDMEQVPLRATLALEEKEKKVYTLQYLAEAYQALGDSDNYLKFLNMGFEEYHHSPYFYPRLIDYYISRNQMNGALQVADRALAMDSTSVLYLYAKSTLLLNMGNYKECIENSKSVDDNLSFIQKQIELVPVIETKERVLDEKSSFIVNF